MDFIVNYEVMQPACQYLSFLKTKSCFWAVRYKKESECQPPRQRAVPLLTFTCQNRNVVRTGIALLHSRSTTCSVGFSQKLFYLDKKEESEAVQMANLPTLQLRLLILWVQILSQSRTEQQRTERDYLSHWIIVPGNPRTAITGSSS